jgi:tRNA threonylcarbamoyladenosine biosynthesis protein TsaE
MEDLDLDVSLPESVVVVEWGEGKVEGLSENRLEVRIERALGGAAADGGPDGGDDDSDPRQVRLTGLGPRWDGVDLAGLG